MGGPVFQKAMQYSYHNCRRQLILLFVVLIGLISGPAVAHAGHLSYALKSLCAHMAQANENGSIAVVKRHYTPTEPHLRRKHDTLEVQVHVRFAPGQAPTKAALNTLGFKVTTALPKLNLIEGWLPVAKLKALAGLTGVRIVKLPDYGISQGTVTPGGDKVIGANRLRAAGLTGQGITVGVISSGIQGIQTVQDAGNLPAGITVIDNNEGNEHEGAYILEIVHRIVPAARLAFCAAVSEADVLQCVQSLQEVGADIVDIDYSFSENPFSPRYLSREEALAKRSDLLWVSSVGNSRENRVNAPFTPTKFTLGNGKAVMAMDFGRAVGEASKPYDTIHLDADAELTVILAWDDDPNAKHPANYYHIYLLDRNNHILAQDTDADKTIYSPSVSINWNNNTGAAQSIRIVITHERGSGTNRIAMDTYSYGVQPYQTPLAINTPTDVNGPDLAQDVLSVGAVNVTTPDQIVAYSNQGPTHLEYIYNATTGKYDRANPLIIRIKPNLVAPTDVSVMGTDGSWGTFAGTSAAGPHVAGAAALLESYGLSKAQVVTAFEKSAIDLGTSGEDNVYGYGRIDAYKALKTVDIPPNVSITAPDKNITINAGKSVTFKGDCASSKHKISAYTWDFDNRQTSSQKDPGAVTFKKAGVYKVTLTCTDSTGIKNPDPAMRTVTVQGKSGQPPLTQPKPNSGHSGGGASGPLELLEFLLLGVLIFIKRGRILEHDRL